MAKNTRCHIGNGPFTTAKYGPPGPFSMGVHLQSVGQLVRPLSHQKVTPA